MTGEQATLGAWAPEEHDRRDELDDDPTPRGVVRAVLHAALVANGDRRFGPGKSKCVNGVYRWCPAASPLRVLDIGAGYGCWASEMRRLAAEQGWPVHITAVELNPDREPHLRKWCDRVAIGDWRAGLADARMAAQHYGEHIGQFDLIIGNPPFAHLLADGKDTDHRPPETTMVPTLLEHAPAVLMMHTQQALLKSECGRAVQRMCPPAAAWQVPGSVNFRSGHNPKCPKCRSVNHPGATRCRSADPYSKSGECGAKLKKWGADSTCYEATLWLRGHTGPCSRYLLPELPSKARRWTVPPGSESIGEARALGLPLAPGYAQTV